MKPGQQGTDKAGRNTRGQMTGSIPLAAHRAFAPLLGLWGALLGGLVVLVLPSAMVVRALSGTLLGTWGTNAQLVLSGSAAVLLGASLLALGLHRHGRVRQRGHALSLARAAVREVTPINPARDLGTRSLDDPLDTMPFSTPAWRDADLATPPRKAEAAAEPAPVAEPSLASAPRELDLAEFAQLPGRNAVWVEDVAEARPIADAAPAPAPAPEPQADPVRPVGAPRLRAVAPAPAAPPPPLPGTAALNRLRSVAPSELSLAQMVERFAGALHEHRTAPRAEGVDPAELAAREAALAEALRALAALSETVTPPPAANRSPDALLSGALAHLHPRRGAA